MEIKIVKLDTHRSESLVTRDDRVVVRVPGYGPALPLPHDLAHFVVEKELGLRRGFWGSVAEGANFPGMTVVSGRQRPHAQARSVALCKANARRVTEVEVIVSVLIQILREKLAPTSRRAASLMAERWTAKKDSEIANVDPPAMQVLSDRLAAMAKRWSQISVGDHLVVEW